MAAHNARYKKQNTKLRKEKKPTLALFSEIAFKKGGILSDIARALNVSRRVVYNWVNDDKEFREVIEDARETNLDIAESRMVTLIKGIPRIIIDEDGEKRVDGWTERPDNTMIIYYTKTLGKHRGFVERSEVQHDAGESFLEFLKQTSK